MNAKFVTLGLLIATATILGGTPAAQARGRGLSAAQIRQRMIQQATGQLNTYRQALAAAETEVNSASGDVSAAQGRVEDARKAIQDARASGVESAKSLKTIEAEILAAQTDGSEFSKASLALHEAQDAEKEARERVLDAASYKEKKAALMKVEDERAAKLAKLKSDTLAEDMDYQDTADKLKAAQTKFVRVKTALFKASAEWVSASKASREADGAESKAHDDATRGAMRNMPAKARLREAQEAAAEARAGIAQAEAILRNLNAPIPKPPAGQPSYTSLDSSSGK
jgi:chromosome segregation ATPase